MPIQRQRPSIAGVITAGTSAASSWSSVAKRHHRLVEGDAQERSDVDGAFRLEPDHLEREGLRVGDRRAVGRGWERGVDRVADEGWQQRRRRPVERLAIVVGHHPLRETGDDRGDLLGGQRRAVRHVRSLSAGSATAAPSLRRRPSTGAASTSGRAVDDDDGGVRRAVVGCGGFGARRGGRCVVVTRTRGEHEPDREEGGREPPSPSAPCVHHLPLYGSHPGWTTRKRRWFPSDQARCPPIRVSGGVRAPLPTECDRVPGCCLPCPPAPRSEQTSTLERKEPHGPHPHRRPPSPHAHRSPAARAGSQAAAPCRHLDRSRSARRRRLRRARRHRELRRRRRARARARRGEQAHPARTARGRHRRQRPRVRPRRGGRRARHQAAAADSHPGRVDGRPARSHAGRGADPAAPAPRGDRRARLEPRRPRVLPALRDRRARYGDGAVAGVRDRTDRRARRGRVRTSTWW